MNGAPKLLYVGRVSKEKGLDTLLAAVDRLRARGCGAELAIVGDGPYLQELMRAHDDADISYLGAVFAPDGVREAVR